MLAVATRLAKDLMVDDRIKLGELNLMRILTHNIVDGLVVMDLYFDGDENQTIVATMSIAPNMPLKAYNQ